MSFDPDPSKQAQEVIFSCKLQKSIYPSLHFSNIAVTQSTTQKHLGMLLDVKLNFQGHLKNIYSKVNKTTGLLCKLHNTLPRLPLLTIYKSFITPHLGYGDIIYDQAYTASFHQKIESVQYNSALAITRTSKENFFQNSFFPSIVIEWNKLDQNIRNPENLNIFKKKLLEFVRPSGNSFFRCHNPKGVK